uniref:DNA polymerase delta subunit 3 n=1 Tax=Timema genevievae TaxID=629358 RepID=A0A7R9PLG3_TIMGE|nr:unnamed protein product [Timema genevievae]
MRILDVYAKERHVSCPHIFHKTQLYYHYYTITPSLLMIRDHLKIADCQVETTSAKEPAPEGWNGYYLITVQYLSMVIAFLRNLSSYETRSWLFLLIQHFFFFSEKKIAIRNTTLILQPTDASAAGIDALETQASSQFLSCHLCHLRDMKAGPLSFIVNLLTSGKLRHHARASCACAVIRHCVTIDSDIRSPLLWKDLSVSGHTQSVRVMADVIYLSRWAKQACILDRPATRVSYAWLSSNLDIDVEKAKLLVENYATQNGLIKPGLEVTYLLAGTLETTGEYIVEVVRQCDLEKVTAQFKEIQSEHIYSVQKEFILKDSTLQSFFDDQIIFDNKRQGLIEYLEALPLSPEEMIVLREKAFATTKTKDDKQRLSQTQKEAQKMLPKVLEQSTLKIVKDAHDGISAIDKNEITTKSDSFKTPAESKEEDVVLFANLGSQKDKFKKNSHSKQSYKGNIASYFSRPKEKSPANSSPEILNHAKLDANSKSVEPKVGSSSSPSLVQKYVTKA